MAVKNTVKNTPAMKRIEISSERLVVVLVGGRTFLGLVSLGRKELHRAVQLRQLIELHLAVELRSVTAAIQTREQTMLSAPGAQPVRTSVAAQTVHELPGSLSGVMGGVPVLYVAAQGYWHVATLHPANQRAYLEGYCKAIGVQLVADQEAAAADEEAEPPAPEAA